jgi:hypothetical protein
MTQPTTTTSNDTASEPLWMRCGKNGDELVRWEDLTDNEKLAAIAEHNKLYGVDAMGTIQNLACIGAALSTPNADIHLNPDDAADFKAWQIADRAMRRLN